MPSEPWDIPCLHSKPNTHEEAEEDGEEIGECAHCFLMRFFGNDDGEAVRVHLEVAGEGLVATT